MSFNNMDLNKVGYCLLPGCPVQHPLQLDCWSELRRYLAVSSDYNAYVQKCKDKNKR